VNRELDETTRAFPRRPLIPPTKTNHSAVFCKRENQIIGEITEAGVVVVVVVVVVVGLRRERWREVESTAAPGRRAGSRSVFVLL